MPSFIIKLVVIALLFSSAEAAMCGILSLPDSDSAVIQLADNDDIDEHSAEIFCSHLCHCAHHLAAFPREMSLKLSTSDSAFYGYFDCYSSKDSPPLFRPPIA